MTPDAKAALEALSRLDKLAIMHYAQVELEIIRAALQQPAVMGEVVEALTVEKIMSIVHNRQLDYEQRIDAIEILVEGIVQDKEGGL